MLKLNIGGGPRKIEGFTNVDVLSWDDKTDIIHDLSVFPYPFETESVDEIVMVEFLEHISFHKTTSVLRECHRILRSGCQMTIQVPDCGRMMEIYVNRKICDCVPHKLKKEGEKFKAEEGCFQCNGKGEINPIRWQYAFTGAQKHEFDLHRNIFTKYSMSRYLNAVGFQNHSFVEGEMGDIAYYKIIVKAIK